jgi:hypothetical protein
MLDQTLTLPEDPEELRSWVVSRSWWKFEGGVISG